MSSNPYFFDQMTKVLADPAVTAEGLKEIVENADLFFKVLRVKLESKDPAIQAHAVQELKNLKKLLKEHK